MENDAEPSFLPQWITDILLLFSPLKTAIAEENLQSSSWDMLLFRCSVVSYSLQSHRLQHARFPCPSLFPRVLKLMSLELMILSNHLILCHPLFLPLISPSLKIFSMNPPYPQSVSFSDFSFLLTLVSQIFDFQWWAAELEFHDTSSWACEVTLACVICVQVHTMC